MYITPASPGNAGGSMEAVHHGGRDSMDGLFEIHDAPVARGASAVGGTADSRERLV